MMAYPTMMCNFSRVVSGRSSVDASPIMESSLPFCRTQDALSQRFKRFEKMKNSLLGGGVTTRRLNDPRGFTVALGSGRSPMNLRMIHHTVSEACGR